MTEPRTLGISTSGEALSLALFEGDRLAGQDHRLIGRGHSEALVPAIAALMGDSRAEAIVVDTGPGSYTGIRIGIAAARALGLAWSVPVTGCSAMHLAAAPRLAADSGPVTIILDAGRGMVFRQAVAVDGAVGPLELRAARDLAPMGFTMADLLRVPKAARSGAPSAIYAPVSDPARPW